MIVDFSAEQLLEHISDYSCAMRTHYFHNCKTLKDVTKSLKQAAEFVKLEWIKHGDPENHPLKKVIASLQKSPSSLFLQIEAEAKKVIKQVAIYSLVCSEEEQRELIKILKIKDDVPAVEEIGQAPEPAKRTRRTKAAVEEKPAAKLEAKNGRKTRSRK